MGSVKTKRKLLDYLESNSKDNIFTISTNESVNFNCQKVITWHDLRLGTISI